jgi:hypothetical protein
MQHVNILRVWYDPKYRGTEVRKVGWQIVDTIAKQYNIKNVRIEVMRGEKAYQKTWGFKRRSVVMERRV